VKRMILEPAGPEIRLPTSAVSLSIRSAEAPSDCDPGVTARQAQQHDEIEGTTVPRWNELLDTVQSQLTPMSTDHPRKQALLLA